MKTLKIFFFAAIFSFIFSSNAQAQIIDSLPWFKAPGNFLTPKILDLKAVYTLQSPRSVIKKSTSMSIAGKKITLPNKVKELKGPITLKRGGNCYELYCARTKSCGDCALLWRDANGDRKIQPRKELRCVCKSGGDNCGIKARKVDCQ